MGVATDLLENALEWLRENYSNFRFFAERDVVWTVQMRLIKVIEAQQLPYTVFNDYPILPGKRRSLSADLAILSRDGSVQVAVEFKYEPSHSRRDILSSKFPVVSWGADGVGKDMNRVQEFVAKGKARVAYAVLVDEGGYFRSRPPHPGGKWVDWGNGVWVHCARVEWNSLTTGGV